MKEGNRDAMERKGNGDRLSIGSVKCEDKR